MRSEECERDEKGECVAEKKLVTALIEYESGGGMGESEAVEEGLRGIIENPKNPTRFSLSSISTTEREITFQGPVTCVAEKDEVYSNMATTRPALAGIYPMGLTCKFPEW